jgi:hypothetical protein
LRLRAGIIVITSEARDLLFVRTGRKQIPPQPKGFVVMTIFLFGLLLLLWWRIFFKKLRVLRASVVNRPFPVW